MFPVSFQVYAQDLDKFPQEKMKQLTQELEIPFLDLLPILRKSYDPTKDAGRMYYDQAHPRTLGNRIIGEAVAMFLLNEKLIDF